MGIWTGLPFLALAIVVVAISFVPATDCGEGGAEGAGERIALLVVTGLGMLGCAAAAALHLVRAGRGYRWLGVAIGSLALIAIATLFLFGDDGLGLVLALFIFGVVATAGACVGLIGLAVAGKTVTDAGALLPLYLIGVGFFVLPVVAIFGLLVNSGIGC